MIRFDQVTKKYAGITVVDGLELTVQKGELIALLGENGAGKTTSISMALGLVKPTVGQISIDGHVAGSMAARRKIGAMLQSAELPEQLKVCEHIKLFQTYYEAPVSLDALTELLGLGEILGKQYGVLSSGQKRKVQLALALCGDPELVILDEPTVGLDVDTRHAFWRVIRGLIQAGKSVLLTTHYLEEADSLADRIIVMAGGKVVAGGTPAEIKALSGGKVIELRTEASGAILKALPGIEKLSYTGDRVQLISNAAEATLKALFASGIEVEDISVARVGLEEAFLSITAKQGEAA